MATPVARKASLSSQKATSVGMHNYRAGKQLEADLERLERERRSKLRQLNQESNHFIDFKLSCHSARSRDNSPNASLLLPSLSPGRDSNSSRSDCSLSPSSPLSSRSPSMSPPKSRSPSPRSPHLRKSSSVEENFRQRAQSSSPEPRDYLLSKRQLSPTTPVRSLSLTNSSVIPLSLINRQSKCSPQGSIKTTTENILRNNAGFLDASTASSIPQILINDEESNRHPSELRHEIPNRQRKNLSSSSEKSKVSKQGGSNGSLAVPVRKYRRNSVPDMPTTASYLRSIAKKESTFVTGDIDKDYHPTRNRPRSSSVCVAYFDHLKDAPRRDSLLQKYVAKRGSYRRTSVTLERLIADLARGVHHTELLNGNFGSSGVSDAEWEKLKECRYLRMPSQDEDVIGNTLDIEEIFSTSERH